jgi:hypothetical protein
VRHQRFVGLRDDVLERRNRPATPIWHVR